MDGHVAALLAMPMAGKLRSSTSRFLKTSRKKDHRTWGIKPRPGVGSFANQPPKRESAAEYENENFRTRRRTWISVVCAIRGLWCDWPACWLRIRTVFGGRLVSAPCCACSVTGHGGYLSGPRGCDPARNAVDRGDCAEPSGSKLDRRYAAASRGAVGNTHRASIVESCLGSRILDMEQQSVPMDGRTLGSSSTRGRSLDSAALAA